MILADLHMHSSYSTDCKTKMSDMIEGAISKGMKTIAFTEHFDIDFPIIPEYEDTLNFLVDMPAYVKSINEYKEKYADRIDILFGIEFGLMKAKKDGYYNNKALYDFDMIIGSTHQVWGYGEPAFDDYFQNAGSEENGVRVYYESILENIETFPFINIYGHIDYIMRYIKNIPDEIIYKQNADIIDAILDKLMEKNVALEINTSGYKYDLGRPHPHSDILKRYYEKGGRLITIGSDAHTPERIGEYFDNASELLKSIGFKEYAVIKKNIPEFYNL